MPLTTVGTSMVSSGGGSVATNTALGNSALAANTTGGFNDAFGSNAAASNTTGTNISAFGAFTLNKNTTGIVNSAFGGSNTIPALYNNTTGSYNCAFGTGALFSNTTASNNTAVGYLAGYVNTGGNNTFIGHGSGSAATTGTYNIFIGRGAGDTVTTGAKNTFIGAYNGNQNGVDTRTTNNYVVLSDGDGNPRQIITNNSTNEYWSNLAGNSIRHADGLVASWANVGSASFNLATVFPDLILSNAFVSLSLQLITTTGVAQTSALINGSRSSAGTWASFSIVNQAGNASYVSSVTGSGTTITINFTIGAQFGNVYARVLTQP